MIPDSGKKDGDIGYKKTKKQNTGIIREKFGMIP
jgi:hypothetical protein